MSNYKYVCAANGIDAVYSLDVAWPGDYVEIDGETKRVTKSVATPIQPGWYKVELFFNEEQMTNTPIQPHQQRVLDEHRELAERLDKLTDFFDVEMFDTLDSAEQDRLRNQWYWMTGYKRCLEMRIKAMGVTPLA